MLARKISPVAAKALLHAGGEIAFLDVREAAAFGDGHPLFAVPCPYSRLEVSTIALVPRADTAVLLIDDGDGIAERCAVRLLACGYVDISVVDGGMPAWRAAGFTGFSGVNVPSKTLGELLEHAHHPRTIDAETLHDWQSTGRPHHFFDARPPAEFAKMRIAGARCLPNGELAHRFAGVVADEAPVVITCAGRTRGIVGALGLAAAGIGNQVFALENGTQGWALAGFPLERGATPDSFPTLDALQRDVSARRAREVMARNGLSACSAQHVAGLLGDDARTTVLFDLRTEAERAARPCELAVPVLAGQLVQATDQYVGVRHSRIVLVDDTGMRAALTALFLRALGLEPYLLILDEEHGPLSFVRKNTFRLPAAPSRISAAEAADLAAAPGVALVDIRPSQAWEVGRLNGSRWAVRPGLLGVLPETASTAILYCQDEATAAAAGLDMAEAGRAVRWLDADLDTCRQAGWSVETDRQTMSREEAVDRVWFVHDRHDGNREASLQYLAWEMGLIAQLDAEERAEFAEVQLT